MQRQTGHSGDVAFATWATCFGVILGPVADKMDWGKAKMANFVKFAVATLSAQFSPVKMWTNFAPLNHKVLKMYPKADTDLWIYPMELKLIYACNAQWCLWYETGDKDESASFNWLR